MARYDAFVLRVWRSGTGKQVQWAGRLEHLPDGATLRFSSLSTLLAHLAAELAHPSPAPGDQSDEAEANVRHTLRKGQQP
jgi:hypothetical protein